MHRIDLRGKWNLVRVSDGTSRPAAIPGDNMSALLEAGEIADPYYDRNELTVQWVGREDWRFEREFEVDGALLDDRGARAALFLHFDSLDTVAEVRLNGAVVGLSDNMFVRRRFAVGEALKRGTNRLSVLLRSPERAASEAAARLPYPLPYSEYPIQSPSRNLLRKVQCHAGWDWGPCLMVSGIYGEVYVGAPGRSRIEYVTTRRRRIGNSTWKLDATVEALAQNAGACSLRLTLSGPSIKEISATEKVDLVAGLNTVGASVEIDDPALWWPNGYGGQPLYDLSVELDGDVVRKRVGFRDLAVVVEDDERGRSMVFKVNGRDLFCKGANWIPTDALPSRQTSAVYRSLLESAHEANMNMLRVWGGGQYESEEFYRTCDELGLLIWHDFMFSCATYPANREFLASVSEEVTHQVKRLMDHPSIALWCGNNENLGALNWFPETRRLRDRYLVDYDRLYEGTVGNLVEELDPDRLFWPSSPSGGRGDYSDNWHDDTKGDMHYWSVWHEGKPFDGYYEVTPRFCSEFGFQSFPSLSTVESYAPAAQRNLTAPTMEHHQRNPRGNTIIIESLSRYFRFPEGLENLLYMSQVQQAYAMRIAVDYWRSQRPVAAGALYWQLNDNWPVASWSSIEHAGKWKLLHFAAKRFYAPLEVVGYVKDDAFQVWVCNDTESRKRGECALSFFDFEGKELQTERLTVDVEADSSALLQGRPLDSLPAPPERLFAVMELRCGNEHFASEAFLTYPKLCPVSKASVTATVVPGEEGLFVELETDAPAFFVAFDVNEEKGRFEDNLLTLLPGRKRRVRFLARDSGRLVSSPPAGTYPALEAKELSAGLTLHHLAGSYR